MWILVIIILASPDYKAGGFATSQTVFGFSSEEACNIAKQSITIPHVKTDNVEINYTKTCVKSN